MVLKPLNGGEDSKIEEIEGNLGNSGVSGMIIMYYHGAFMDCISLTEVTLPKSISTFKAGAFYYCIYNHRTTKTNQKYPSVNL